MKKLVFVVDDSDANLTMAASALEETYRVLTMPSAEKMFALLAKNKIPDIILLDIEMPKMNGMDALRKLRKEDAYSGIPVLFLTGHSDGEVREKAVELGAEGVLEKPIDPATLRAQVAEHLKLCFR